MLMTTANEALFDSLIRHQIFLLRFSGSVRNKIYELLNATEQDIAEKIRDRLRNANGLSSPADLRRLDVVLRLVKNIRSEAWQESESLWASEIIELAKTEPETLNKMIIATAPVVVDTSLPSPKTLKAIVTSKPFEGRTLKEWARKIADEDLRRIENQIRLGMVSGESSAQIARRVVGSAKLKGADGVTEITRRQAASITRTAVNFTANQARTEYLKENKDILAKEQYVATLDSRTTAVCRANDGKLFKLGEGPIPPLHFNCRSLRVPFLEDSILVERPAKPVTEKMLLREFAEKNKIKSVSSRNNLPFGTKRKFDKYKRQRIRELTGQIPSATNYQEWLTRQSKEFQDDVLGSTKGKLFREGNLKLDRFVNRTGDELNLSELARKEAQAFRAAGLDPKDFL